MTSMRGPDRYDALKPVPAPAPDSHYYGPLRETQQQQDAQREQPAAPEPAPHKEPQPYLTELDAIEARRSAYTEILNERLASGKINGTERSNLLMHFEVTGTIKYKDDVAARMRHHQELQEARDVAAEVRDREGAEQDKELENEGRER
jgi:hypothetical protein